MRLESKTLTVQVRVTRTEKLAIVAAAGNRDLSVSDWVRGLMKSGAAPDGNLERVRVRVAEAV
jgi:hypothetical protein